MDKTIEIGDEVKVWDIPKTVVMFDKFSGLYLLDDSHWYSRYQFTATKWEDDIVGNTGIGVCAKSGSGTNDA